MADEAIRQVVLDTLLEFDLISKEDISKLMLENVGVVSDTEAELNAEPEEEEAAPKATPVSAGASSSSSSTSSKAPEKK